MNTKLTETQFTAQLNFAQFIIEEAQKRKDLTPSDFTSALALSVALALTTGRDERKYTTALGAFTHAVAKNMEVFSKQSSNND